MLVSVITAARNAESTIEKCINSVNIQKFGHPYEHLIVEDGSTDNTEEIIKKYERKIETLHFIKGPGTGPGAARNVGVRKAKGKIIVFIDADCEADKEWLKNLVDPIMNKKVSGTCGSVKTPDEISIIGKVIGLDWEYRQEKNIIENKKWFHMMNTAYDRNCFDEVGFIDEDLITGEDIEFFQRVVKNNLVAFVKNAIVYHYHRQSLMSYFRQFYYYGKGSYVLYQKGAFSQIVLPLYFTSLFTLLLASIIYSKLILITFMVFMIGIIKYFINSIEVLLKSRNLMSILILPLSYLGRFVKYLGFISKIVNK